LVSAYTDSNAGFGEGCPREYVTQESVDTAIDFFRSNEEAFLQLTSLEDISSWANDNQQIIDENPAAWCAVELALLDLFGKEKNRSIEAVLSLPELNGDFQYTAVLDSSGYRAFTAQLAQYAQNGFTDFKIKVSGDLDEDRQKLRLFQDKKVRIRLDANNLWQTAEEACAYVAELEYPFFAIEEPVASRDYDSLHKVAVRLDTRIILDESFIRFDDFKLIGEDAQRWIVNLRISKMGGLIRSLKVADEARRRGVSIIIGAQVGETSLLTRAALTVANPFRDILLAQEGAFGILLLERDIVEHPLMFAEGGVLRTASSDFSSKSGLGLEVIHGGAG
jgi:L-alanine-DL-glutamate epimerase-like enolase superfamily enzyme